MLSLRGCRLLWIGLGFYFSWIIRSGVVPIVQRIKKTGVETTYRFRGESGVKVKKSLESTCCMEKENLRLQILG